jgi:hypothetical protein
VHYWRRPLLYATSHCPSAEMLMLQMLYVRYLSSSTCAPLLIPKQDAFVHWRRSLVFICSRPMTSTTRVRRFWVAPWVVKITSRVHSTEADALRYLSSTRLNLPIPRFIASFVDDGATYTIMTRLPGIIVSEAGRDGLLCPVLQQTIMSEVSSMLEQLATLRPPPHLVGKIMASASGHDLPDGTFFFEERCGPFSSHAELWTHMGEFGQDEYETEVDAATRSIMDADPIRFVHADLRMYNVLIHEGHVSGIIDWEDAGWFPSSWQVHTMRWARMGCHAFWLRHWRENYRFPTEAEAAYDASKTFLIKSPV